MIPMSVLAGEVGDLSSGETLYELASDDEMDKNHGTITTNNGYIYNNYGTVTTNKSEIDNNYGIVTNTAAGTVNTNEAGGSVTGGVIKWAMNGGTAKDCSIWAHIDLDGRFVDGGMTNGEAINCTIVGMEGGTATDCTIKIMSGGTARGAKTVIEDYRGGEVSELVPIENIKKGGNPVTEDDVSRVEAIASEMSGGGSTPSGGCVHKLQVKKGDAATCAAPGFKDYYQCTVCNECFSDEACQEKIPDLDAWKAGAGKLEKTTTHTPGTAYTHDNTNHWKTCTVCNTALTHEAHQESDTYSHDNTGHWKTCTVCDVALSSTEHDIGTNGKCADCGYDSTCTHTYGTGVANGATGHRKTCTKCGDVITEAHISGGSATATSPEVCKVCGYELSPALGGGASGGGSTPSGGAAVSTPEPVISESPYRVFLFDTVPQVKNAAQGATLKLELDGWNALPLWFMKEIAARRDVTINLTYRYQAKKYDVTFPAGMVIAFDEKIPYYGPLKLADMAIRSGGICNITQ